MAQKVSSLTTITTPDSTDFLHLVEENGGVYTSYKVALANLHKAIRDADGVDTGLMTVAQYNKLAGIETGADVTDTANVTAAGALMDSEVTNLAQVKAFDSADYATAAQGATADSAMQDLVNDATPTLGGNLVVAGFSIISTANGDIVILPDGTGDLILDGLKWPQADGTAGQVLKTDGLGQLSWVTVAGGSSIGNLHEDADPQLAADLDLYYSSNQSIFNSNDGRVRINQNTALIQFPATRGSAGQGLIDLLGDGDLSWALMMTELADDSAPALAGNLTVDGYAIVATGANNIELTPATGAVVLDGLNWPTADAGAAGMVLGSNGAGQLAFYNAVMDTDFSQNGILVRTASGVYAARSMTAGSGISITNPGGVSGAPVITNSILNFTDLQDMNLTGSATGDLYYRDASGNIVNLGIGTAGQIVQVSAGGLPEWANNTPAGSTAFNDLSDVTITTVATDDIVVYTGSGWANRTPAQVRTHIDAQQQDTYLQSLADLGGSYAAGDLIYYLSGTTLSRLPIGTNGQFLSVSGGALTWVADPGGNALNVSNETVEVVSSANLTGFDFGAGFSVTDVANVATINYDFATQLEAEAFTENTKPMNAERTGQAIDAKLNSVSNSLAFSTPSFVGAQTGDAAHRSMTPEEAKENLDLTMVKDTVRVASTGNIDTSTLDAGDSIDNVTVAEGDRVLLKDQTSASENGIWIVGPSTGSASRAPDMDGLDNTFRGSYVFVRQGDTWQRTIWMLTTFAGTDFAANSKGFTQVGGGASQLNDLDDVGLSGEVDNDFLVYDTDGFYNKTLAQTQAILGLGTMASQSSSAVNITGGSITGVTGITATSASRILLTVENANGGTINEGDAVYITGENAGGTPTVDLADADTAAKMPAIGLVYESGGIASGATGEVILQGFISGLNTSGYSLNDPLYVSTTATTNNTLTSTKPAGESNGVQKVATVARAHASQGSIYVSGANRQNDVPNLDNGAIFIGNSSNYAVQATLSGPITITEAGVTDINIASVANMASALATADTFLIKDDTDGDTYEATLAQLDTYLATSLASTFAPIADPTFTGEIGIGAVNVSETELGILEGATVTTTELNYVSGVTSAIQTQLDGKQASGSYLTGASPVMTTPQINDTSADHQYIFAVSELAADRTVTLPLLAANDIFMFRDFHKATAADIDAWTEDNEYITPKQFADSAMGRKSVSLQITDGSSALTVADGQGYFRVPAELDGMTLVDFDLTVSAPSTSGAITWSIERGRQASATTAHAWVDMLSTSLTVDVNEYDSINATTAPVIKTDGSEDVQEGDLIRFNCDGIGSGPSAVVIASLSFEGGN